MSSLNNLNKRLNYQGGNTEGRLRRDKLIGLKRAMFNSYQAQTAILKDGREFKCLINPDKENMDYDNKIISIPYEDICLNPVDKDFPQKTTDGIEEIGMKTGDVFTWKETDTHWLVFLEYLEEDAYFRSKIRRCDQTIKVDETDYWVYLRGPVETSVPWNQKAGVEWNDINYSLVMYITLDDKTADYFHRFTKVKITNPASQKSENWQVVATNPYYGDGIIEVFLDEDFNNSIEDAAMEEAAANAPEEPNTPDLTQPYISGPAIVTIYDTGLEFIANNFTDTDCYWYLDDSKLAESKNKIILEATKVGKFTLKYKGTTQSAEFKVTIKDF